MQLYITREKFRKFQAGIKEDGIRWGNNAPSNDEKIAGWSLTIQVINKLFEIHVLYKKEIFFTLILFYKKPVYKKPRARIVKILRNSRAGISAT